MPRGRNQTAQYYGQCSRVDIGSHMQRRTCFPDDFDKIGINCGLPVNDFKPPGPDVPPPPTKKKRRVSNAATAALNAQSSSSIMQDLLPPPLTGYGDTIVASNPFDDTPPSQTSSLSRHNSNLLSRSQIPVGSCMSTASLLGAVSPCQMTPSSMACSMQMGNTINCSLSLGSCTSVGGVSNMHCSSVPSPHRNQLCLSVNNASATLNCASSNNLMNSTHRNAVSSLGNPLSSVMTSNLRGNSPMDCVVAMNSVALQKGNSIVSHPHTSVSSNVNCASPIGSPITSGLASCGTAGMNVRSPMSVAVSCSINESDININVNNAVYPADKSKVFNPQNPNAPPIYPCGICHKEVHDNGQAVLCESGCNFWFHRICSGLTEAAYQLLTAEVYAEWVCDKCLNTKNIPLVKFKP